MENLSTSAYGYVVNRSFHVVDRKKTAAKCEKMKNDGARCAKQLLFLVVKYGNFICFCSCGRASDKTSTKSLPWWLEINEIKNHETYRPPQI